MAAMLKSIIKIEKQRKLQIYIRAAFQVKQLFLASSHAKIRFSFKAGPV